MSHAVDNGTVGTGSIDSVNPWANTVNGGIGAGDMAMPGANDRNSSHFVNLNVAGLGWTPKSIW